MEAQPVSLLRWMFQSLGLFYSVAIPLAGLVVFLISLLAVMFCKRPGALAAFLVLLPLPAMIGLLGTIQGLIQSLQVMAQSTASPKPSELAAGVALGLFSSLVGLAVTFPSYLILALGLLLRTTFSRSDEQAAR